MSGILLFLTLLLPLISIIPPFTPTHLHHPSFSSHSSPSSHPLLPLISIIPPSPPTHLHHPTSPPTHLHHPTLLLPLISIILPFSSHSSPSSCPSHPPQLHHPTLLLLSSHSSPSSHPSTLNHLHHPTILPLSSHSCPSQHPPPPLLPPISVIPPSHPTLLQHHPTLLIPPISVIPPSHPPFSNIIPPISFSPPTHLQHPTFLLLTSHSSQSFHPFLPLLPLHSIISPSLLTHFNHPYPSSPTHLYHPTSSSHSSRSSQPSPVAPTHSIVPSFSSTPPPLICSIPLFFIPPTHLHQTIFSGSFCHPNPSSDLLPLIPSSRPAPFTHLHHPSLISIISGFLSLILIISAIPTFSLHSFLRLRLPIGISSYSPLSSLSYSLPPFFVPLSTQITLPNHLFNSTLSLPFCL